MRKLLKSKKALSPVVAAIILIAVTVAVSIAVAAWMGSLTIGFMETSELTVTQMTFDTANNRTTVYLTNSGTSDVTVSMVKINGNTVVDADIPMTSAIAAGDQTTLTLDYDQGNGIAAGNKYSISLFATDGTLVGQYTDTA
jgi:flagellin-like protein